MFPDPSELEITPQELHDVRSSDEPPPFRLVDCREEDEFAICRIDGAELVPLSRFAELAPTRLLDDPKSADLPVVVYCHHGMRSLHATTFLRENGLGRTWSLSGGIDLWSTRIDPAVPRY